VEYSVIWCQSFAALAASDFRQDFKSLHFGSHPKAYRRYATEFTYSGQSLKELPKFNVSLRGIAAKLPAQ
jgi:hypothetical protein